LRTFLLRRLVTMVLVWVGVSLLTFLIANVVPSDPVVLRLGPKASAEAVAFWRHQWGLDLPLHTQYLRYVGGLLRGDLGDSIWSGRPVAQDLADYLPATIELALAAIAVTGVVGIPLGALAAARRGGWLDRLVQALAAFGLAVPLFWLGLVFQLLFYRQWSLLPLDGRIDFLLGPPVRMTGLYTLDSLLQGDWPRLGSSLVHLILPTATLAIFSIAGLARMVRASTLEELGAEYVRTARAKGLAEETVLRRHVLRNALLPAVTLLGLTFNSLMAGVFVVETIFNWPGIGWYATHAILAADYGAVVSTTLVVAVIATTVNLLVDIAYRLLDPRIQFS